MRDWRTLAAFLVLTFGITWGIAGAFLAAPGMLTERFGPLDLTSPFFLVAVYAPGLAGVTMVVLTLGTRGLTSYLSRLGRVRAPWPWYVWLLLGIPAVMLLGAAYKGTLDPPRAVGLAGALLLAAVIGPVEELGWRGFALPLLQRHISPVAAGLSLGVVRGIWYLPVYFLGATPQSGWSVLPYLAGGVAVSVIMTGLYNASRGSLLLVMVMHFQLDNPLWPDARPFDAAILVLVGLIVYMLERRGAYSRENAERSVA